MSKTHNYVYLITEISTNMKYIGVRSCDTEIIDDLGNKYKSSSTNIDFINRQDAYREDYSYQVLGDYETRKEAINEEMRLHHLYNVDTNQEYYNKVKSQSYNFDACNKVVVRDVYGNTYQVSKNDERYLLGDLVSVSKGTVSVKDTNNKTLKVSVQDPRYLSGELVSTSTGIVAVKDKNNKNMRVPIDDQRYLSGELKHIMHDTISVKDELGNNYKVNKNNSLYLSGKLVGQCKGTIVVKDKDGNMQRVPIDDSRYISGELISPCKDTIMINDGTTSKYIHKTSTVPMGWFKGSLSTKIKGASGGANGYARKTSIDGIIFDTIKEAALYLNMSRAMLNFRLKSSDTQWEGWFRI